MDGQRRRIASGLGGILFWGDNSASDDDSRVEQLLDRVNNGVLAEDRRSAITELQQVVAESSSAQLAFSAMGLPVILSVLKEERDDTEIIRGALETLVSAITPIDTVPGQKNEVRPASMNADLLSRESESISLLLSLLSEDDFYVRYYTLQLLTALLTHSSNRLQEAILSIPHGIIRLMDMLMDREVIIVAFPVKNFMLLLQKMKVTVVLWLSFFILIAITGSCISSKLFRRLQRQKTYALANLIKQKEATQQAERKSMNKSLAFASASHDVRASLAGITGLIRLCHDDVPPDSDVARNLVQMDRCASKLLGILNSVLDTSKVEAGKMQLEDVEFNMAQAIEESVDIFHVVALGKGLDVIWDPCDFSVLMCSNVRGDCRRFKQILDNLLSNAIKFTSEGHVIVRAWAKKANSKNSVLTSIQQSQISNIPYSLSRWLCNIGRVYSNKRPINSIDHNEGDMEFIFEVDDTGIGIPKEKRASIFENYVQVNDSTEGYEGTGLGLGIVQSYVRLMYGDIGVKEKQPGEKGSFFMFNIFLKSIDVSSNNIEECFDSCKIPMLNRLHSFSPKTRSKVQPNMHAMAISQVSLKVMIRVYLLVVRIMSFLVPKMRITKFCHSA